MQVEDRRAPNEVTKRIEQVVGGDCFMLGGTSYMRLHGADKKGKYMACRLADGNVHDIGKGHEVSMVKATVVIKPPEEE